MLRPSDSSAAAWAGTASIIFDISVLLGKDVTQRERCDSERSREAPVVLALTGPESILWEATTFAHQLVDPWCSASGIAGAKAVFARASRAAKQAARAGRMLRAWSFMGSQMVSEVPAAI